MRVLVAPDGFTGTLSAARAARALADGWRAGRPGDQVELCPLSDGGPGFVEVLHGALGGHLLEVVVSGPLGAPVAAVLLLAPDGTAHVESAAACGAALVPASGRDPLAASTTGVGQLLAAARDAGAHRVVVGLGGSCTTDGGAGALAALGAGPAGALGRGGGALTGVGAQDLAGLARVRREWARVELVAASDVDVPLLGPRGAARGFAPQKGADPRQVQALEAGLCALAGGAREVLGQDLSGAPGAGAAGGLGFGLALLGASRTGGARAVAAAVGLRDRVRRCDLVLTGEGSLDWQSLRGKVVAQVAAAGRGAGVPVVAVAGQVRLAPGEAEAAGLAAAHAVAGTPAQVAASLAAPASALAERTRAVACAWTPAAAPGARA